MKKAPAATPPFHHLRSSLSSTFKPILKECEKISLGVKVTESFKSVCTILVDSLFKFEGNQMILQGNFAPVDEIGESVVLSSIEGEIPTEFPEGVYIRNGANPIFPDQTIAVSFLGTTSLSWFQGDGMVHATYFNKDKEGNWNILYKNRYIEAETFKMEKENNKALFLPGVEGQPLAVLASIILNLLRFGKVNKDYNNTNVFQHGGKVYTITENHLPYEINISNLDTLDAWDVNGAWDRPFTSHPKVAPGTGELVTMGVDAKKPYYVLGVISADGKKMIHKVDLKFKSSVLSHELAVTENYNIIMDYPLQVGIEKVIEGGMFIEYNRNQNSRIGVMPRYGDAESTTWFQVENHCTFHIINSFEDGDEVVIRGCRSTGSIIPGPDHKTDKSQWYRRAYLYASSDSEGFDPSIDGVIFPRPYEWRLNMKTGEVKEAYLTGTKFAMDFPTINNNLMGRKNKYAYTQVVDSIKSSNTGMSTYKMFAKLYFDEHKGDAELINVEYHALGDNQFCSGIQFVGKPGGIDEDDGWLVCYVHDEKANVSQVYIVDANKFSEAPVTKITLPQRVPYGFHATFIQK